MLFKVKLFCPRPATYLDTDLLQHDDEDEPPFPSVAIRRRRSKQRQAELLEEKNNNRTPRCFRPSLF